MESKILKKIKQLNSLDVNNKHKSKIGAVYAIAANILYALGNIISAGYPTTSGIFFWRGVGAAGVFTFTKPKLNRYSIILGLVHATHMTTYVILLRIGPAWFGAATLSAVPAILWAKRRTGNILGALLVLVMLGAGILFAIDPSSSAISNKAIILGIVTMIFVSIRNECANLWAEKIDPNGALLILFTTIAIVGFTSSILWNEKLTFIFWAVLAAVVISSLGHRSIYASARRCEPVVIAVANPFAILVTAIGAYFVLDEDLPKGLQLIALLIWVICGVWISFFLKTSVHKKDTLEKDIVDL